MARERDRLMAQLQYKTCARCGHTYRPSGTRQCPHQAVVSRFGPTICRYCCKKCKHDITGEYGHQTCELNG